MCKTSPPLGEPHNMIKGTKFLSEMGSHSQVSLRAFHFIHTLKKTIRIKRGGSGGGEAILVSKVFLSCSNFEVYLNMLWKELCLLVINRGVWKLRERWEWIQRSKSHVGYQRSAFHGIIRKASSFTSVVILHGIY